MTTMVDELYDRHYQAGRAELHDGLDRLVKRASLFARGFRTLNAIRFAAPWNKRPQRA